jgi:hypothetical protein
MRFECSGRLIQVIWRAKSMNQCQSLPSIGKAVEAHDAAHPKLESTRFFAVNAPKALAA